MIETDSLDADGEVSEIAEVPPLDAGTVEKALRRFLGRHPQLAPKVSAIKRRGTPLHRLARRGEDVQAPVREVELFDAAVRSVGENEIALGIHCGKGFYVRSLARDLARSLGTRGHVKALRRTASGRFSIEDAIEMGDMSAESIGAHLIPLDEACASLMRVELTAEGVGHARHGRPIGPDSALGEQWKEAPSDASLALFAPDGEPVALGRRVGDTIRVVRGFKTENPMC